MATRPVLTRVSLVLALSAGCSLALSAGCSRTHSESPAPAADEEPAAVASADPDPVAAEPDAAVDAAEPEVAAVAPAEPAEPPPPKKSPTLEMTFVGDIIFGRYRDEGFDPIPEDGYAVFEPMAEALRSDVLIGNLETPLVYDLPESSPIGSRFAFGASKEHAQLLVDAGFDAVSLANNHWYDQRRTGVEETPKILSELGIVPVGGATDEPEVFRVQPVEANGWRIGVLAFTNRSNAPQRDDTPTLPFLNAREVAGTVAPVMQAARDEYDVLVGFVHWGEEYEDGPSGAQKNAAHALIDAGADLVVAHHPHVVQGIEVYGDGLIAYSMGNFLFENTNDPARLTGVLRVRLRAGETRACREEVLFHPAYVKRMPVQHPVPAKGYMGRKVRDRMRMVSKRFGTSWDDVEVDEASDKPIDLKLVDSKPCGGE